MLLVVSLHVRKTIKINLTLIPCSELNPEETQPDETDEESDGLGLLKGKFSNLKINTSGKSGNGSRLTFTKAGAGTLNKVGESKKGSAASEKKKPIAGAGASAEGALSPTSFFRTAGTATKGGDRKVRNLCRFIVGDFIFDCSSGSISKNCLISSYCHVHQISCTYFFYVNSL